MATVHGELSNEELVETKRQKVTKIHKNRAKKRALGLDAAGEFDFWR
jgi:hypothetical protein